MSGRASRVGFRDVAMSTVALVVAAALLTVVVVSTLNRFSSSVGGTRTTPSQLSAVTSTESAQRIKAVHDSNESQAGLVANEDGRIALLRSTVAPARYRFSDNKTPYRIQSNAALPTLVLTPSLAVYTAADLRRLMPKTFVIKPDGTALLSENIAISQGVTVVLNSAQVSDLELASSKVGFASIVSFGGALRLVGTAARPLRVTSWDEGDSRPDVDPDNGRAYLRAIGGTLELSHVHAMHLGFWSGRTGGIAMTGSNRSASGGGDDLATGSISDSAIDGDAFGLFATVTRALTVRRTSVSHSVADGVVLHRSVTETSVTDTDSSDNGGAGFLIDRGASSARLAAVTAAHNAGDGIKVDGEPLARGASASGASTDGTSDNQIVNSMVVQNGRAGIEILAGSGIVVRADTVTGNLEGIVVRAGAQSPTIADNIVDNQLGFGIFVRDQVTAATVAGNHIDRGTTGIVIRDSSAAVTKNVIRHADGHAISLVGAAGHTQVLDNTLGGRGASALDRRRAETRPIVGGNDASSWRAPSTEYLVRLWILRPVHVVWTALFALILISTAFTRHQRGRQVHPYADQVQLIAEQPLFVTLAPDRSLSGVPPVAKDDRISADA